MNAGPDPLAPPTPAEAAARLREAAQRSREHAAAAVTALRKERTEIDRERRAHPSYEEARRERRRRRS